MAKALAKGSRITGAQRTTLASQYAKRYAAGESIRKIADDAGRSYGFVHGVLKESGVELRGRGGATRGVKKTASTPARPRRPRQPRRQRPKKAPAKTAGSRQEVGGQEGSRKEVHRQDGQAPPRSGGQEALGKEGHRQGGQGSRQEVGGQEGPRKEDNRQEGFCQEALTATSPRARPRRCGRALRCAYARRAKDLPSGLVCRRPGIAWGR